MIDMAWWKGATDALRNTDNACSLTLKIAFVKNGMVGEQTEVRSS